MNRCQQQPNNGHSQNRRVKKHILFNPYLLQQLNLFPKKTTFARSDLLLGEQKKEDRGKITLCLDLDETLISSSFQEPENYDFSCTIEDVGETYQVYVKKRPFLDYFLERVSKMFEVVIFTASRKCYADKILDRLDPQKETISYRLYRDSCSLFCGSYIKDLSLLNRDLNSVLIVDDLPCSFLFHRENAIKIPPFSFYKHVTNRGSDFDFCLETTLQILEQVHIQHDVVSILSQPFQFVY
ncbi:scp1-like small phosphatase 4-related [Anaeramoeba flamelloides]|uniref:Scp1-like small phosphatase 4-related n=1 Tax=Anaeramoeba flamelloides TaxID=1746091 RepID=A0ABQ8XWW9_9EUKA|nr:scp1-like small phosphatase 4-related [Anaeramoeba flamelloides]